MTLCSWFCPLPLLVSYHNQNTNSHSDLKGWSEGADGTRCHGANQVLVPGVREAKQVDMAVGLTVTHAKLVTQ